MSIPEKIDEVMRSKNEKPDGTLRRKSAYEEWQDEMRAVREHLAAIRGWR